MKLLSFRITSAHLLLCVFLLQDITDSSTPSTPGTTLTGASSTEAKTTTPLLTTPLTTLSITKTAPPDAIEFRPIGQNETSITLQWKVDGFLDYTLVYGVEKINVSASAEHEQVTHTISGLTSGTTYIFILFTVSGSVSSSGVNLTAATAPENVQDVKVSTQTETSITLMWDKVKNIPTYTLQYNNNGSLKEESISDSHQETSVTHEVSSLTAGTKYHFTLITVFADINSTGYTFDAVTAPLNAKEFRSVGQNETSITLQWGKVNGFLDYTLVYDEETINVSASAEHEQVTHTISGLTSGTTYVFILFTVFENVSSSGVNLTAATAPENVQDVKVSTQTETSITLMWDKVKNIPTYTLQYNNNGSLKEESISDSHQETSVTHEVSSLTAGTKYHFTLITVFADINSTGYTFDAVTAPPNAKEFRPIGQNETSITLQWGKVNGSLDYTLVYGDKKINVSASAEHEQVTHTISGLTSGTTYVFILFTVFENVSSSGVNLTAATAPENVQDVKVSTQTETSITLMWDKVKNIPTYTLQYNNNGSLKEESISDSHQETSVTHEVSSLTAGTKYHFTLITVFADINSTGYTFDAVTAPPNAKEFRPIGQNETSITLQWGKVNGSLDYTLVYGDKKINVSASAEHEQVTHSISGLTSGTTYVFILFTVFENVSSSGVNLTAATAPENVQDVKVSTQTETSITLMWDKVKNISAYILQYDNNGSLKEESISDSHQETSVTHEVSSLTAGTKYHFTLITVFADINSTGYTFDAVTVPSMVTLVRVTERAVTSITLEWSVNVNKDWSYFLQMNGENLQLHPNRSRDVVSHSFTSLQPGTEYPFSVITMFSGLNSTAYKNFTLTAINCSTVAWHVTNTSIHGTIEGLFTSATATNVSQDHIRLGDHSVSFTNLRPGATYNVSLWYERNSTYFQQCRHELTIIPPNIRGHCEYMAAGYSVLIVLAEPDGVWETVEVNVTGETSTMNKEQRNIEIQGLQPAKTYEVSLASLSKTGRRSERSVFWCSTDPRGVIAGSVFAVLLFGALVCLALFILLKRPDIISRKKSFIGGSKLSYKKCKAISAAKFADHVYQLSEDENRGFSLEYESLIPVGTEQTQKDALLPENKARNRFTNVLPYDWCRVKLTTSIPNGKSDYINASYMPGYNSNREYIATQGPLPSTVNDFWRMVWEQRVRGIVMVTNCTEGGRTKCEQYWPADSEPRLLGELLVTMRSEQQEPNWTLREFRLEHCHTSEERTVKHFHFTAWPDHGVPQSTEVLIQFRGLVRQHIERDGAGAPTVVHCSAGVGRTGTIIALDVLLQQLVKEREVGINAFVHKMRLSRPHMVQTESQYVFLHQCIIDCLKPNEKTEENIYENADMIYANATALREFHSNT
ncbi:receptor-type tyrosine-protein phosphatase H-like isoform X2 [Chaetodon trifascialis]|uniref:receptor-type tyrosine-protein phosphatase H-like isoform X2 n=1 Tax=Chaetodon trifascialis TaxID=109706 RepID=UPI003991AE09